MCTTWTLGQTWCVLMYTHTIAVCPVHVYHWDTGKDMGRTYVLIGGEHERARHLIVSLLDRVSVCSSEDNGYVQQKKHVV